MSREDNREQCHREIQMGKVTYQKVDLSQRESHQLCNRHAFCDVNPVAVLEKFDAAIFHALETMQCAKQR